MSKFQIKSLEDFACDPPPVSAGFKALRKSETSVGVVTSKFQAREHPNHQMEVSCGVHGRTILAESDW